MNSLKLFGYSYLDFKEADKEFKKDDAVYYFNPSMLKYSDNEIIFTARCIVTYDNKLIYKDHLDLDNLLSSKSLFERFRENLDDSDESDYSDNDTHVSYEEKVKKELGKYKSQIIKNKNMLILLPEYQDEMYNKIEKNRNKYELLKYKDIIPGNHPDCESVQKEDIGKNFIWNHWNTPFYIYDLKLPNFYTIELTKIFKCDISKQKLIELKPNIDISGSDNRIAEIKDYKENNYSKIIYSSSLDSIYKIKNIDNIDVINLEKINSGLCLNTYKHNKDYNLTPYYIKFKKVLDNSEICNNITVLNWFSNEKGLYINEDFDSPPKTIISYIHGFSGEGSYIITEKTKNNEVINQEKIEIAKEKFKKHYGRLPGFSFGTPVLYISLPERIDASDVMLGCGHTKIRNNPEKYPYISGSNIEKFRETTHKDMRKLFGNKYKIHLGTGFPSDGELDDCFGNIYLLYFYILWKDSEGNYQMYLSDSYLPVNLGEKERYKFSLVFPMGIIKHNENNENYVLISCGEGDFYSIILKFRLDNIIKSCRHNLRNITMDNYEFKYLVKNSDGTFETKNEIC